MILAYTIIQQIESNIIQLLVMKQAVRLRPALVLFALLMMGTLFGAVGLVLAVPLVATFQVLVNELWVNRMDQVGEDTNPPDRRNGRETPRPYRSDPQGPALPVSVLQEGVTGFCAPARIGARKRA